jgi:hypothetical protein
LVYPGLFVALSLGGGAGTFASLGAQGPAVQAGMGKLRHAISVSSTSTRPASGLRPGASMLQRSLAQISHAVL